MRETRHSHHCTGPFALAGLRRSSASAGRTTSRSPRQAENSKRSYSCGATRAAPGLTRRAGFSPASAHSPGQPTANRGSGACQSQCLRERLSCQLQRDVLAPRAIPRVGVNGLGMTLVEDAEHLGVPTRLAQQLRLGWEFVGSRHRLHYPVFRAPHKSVPAYYFPGGGSSNKEQARGPTLPRLKWPKRKAPPPSPPFL